MEKEIILALEKLSKSVDEFNESKKQSFISALKEVGLENEYQSVIDKGMPEKIFISPNILDKCLCLGWYAPTFKSSILPENTIIFLWNDERLKAPDIDSYATTPPMYPNWYGR